MLGADMRAISSATDPDADDTMRDRGFAYVRGLMAPELMATGLTPDRAWQLARTVEDRLAGGGRRRVAFDELREPARDVLGDADGDATVVRFRRWHEFAALGRPLVVLIGGATGVGKSTVATRLAQHLGISRVAGTDFIRQVLRSVVPEAIAPELARSSYELDQNGTTSHAEFERQAREVMVGVQATIERAAREGMSLILEGIHLLPGLVDAHASDALAVHVVLSVEDAGDHEHRFELRAGGSQRPAARYDDGLDAIRRLQQHIVATSRRSDVPVVENRDEDATVRRVLDVVFAAVDDALRSPGPR
jgi:2-phosphoglycerate kinase